MKASGIILAGGYSSRMGQDKTLMPVNAETLIERAVTELRKTVDEIIIASNQKAKYNLPGTVEVEDIYPGMGPLGGIHAGLSAANYQYAFVMAADMPLFSADLAGYLLNRCDGYDVVAPEVNGQWEPLCAVYAKDCIKPIEKLLAEDVKKAQYFLSLVRVLKISQKELAMIGKTNDIFYNLNTPEDYQKFLSEGKYKESI